MSNRQPTAKERPLLKEQTKVITGNAAAAYGALLCRPDVIAAYPITPQSEVIEQLARFHADGLLEAEYVTVEGENSAQNVVCGASMAGGRVFPAEIGPRCRFGRAGSGTPEFIAPGQRQAVLIVIPSPERYSRICTESLSGAK